MSNPAPAIYFIHIAKTAGTSVISMLQTRFAAGEMLRIFEEQPLVDLQHALPPAFDRYRVIAAHAGYDLVARFPRPPRVMTFLREPVDRAVSAFYFLRAQNPSTFVDTQYQHDIRRAKELSLLDFIEQEPLAAVRHLGNMQTAFLSGDTIWDEPWLSMTTAMLERAKEHLHQCDFVGLSERMDDSMALLAFTFRLDPFGEAVRDNVTRSRPQIADLDDATRTAVASLVQYDADLYRLGQTIFAERWQNMISSLLRMHGRGGERAELPHEVAPASATLTFDQAIPGAGWYGRQELDGRWISWTGPSKDAWVELTVAGHRPMLLRFRVVHALADAVLDGLDVRVNDVSLSCRRSDDAQGIWFEALVPASAVSQPDHRARITWRVDTLLRPIDVDPTRTDARLIGIALDRVELLPADQVDATSSTQATTLARLTAQLSHIHTLVTQAQDECAALNGEAAARHRAVDALHAHIAQRDQQIATLHAEIAALHQAGAAPSTDRATLHTPDSVIAHNQVRSSPVG